MTAGGGGEKRGILRNFHVLTPDFSQYLSSSRRESCRGHRCRRGRGRPRTVGYFTGGWWLWAAHFFFFLSWPARQTNSPFNALRQWRIMHDPAASEARLRARRHRQIHQLWHAWAAADWDVGDPGRHRVPAVVEERLRLLPGATDAFRGKFWAGESTATSIQTNASWGTTARRSASLAWARCSPLHLTERLY